MIHTATIYALASAPGKAGVAVIRISGPRAVAACGFLGMACPAPRAATLASLRHGGVLLDQALVLYFNAPHSFTGEDVVELHLHGSSAVVRAVLDALAQMDGLRLAEPGEFTRRAFLNNKIDLAQAEGLADLIDAETTAQHAQALRQLGGEASRRVAALREAVLTPLALLEAYIDFPDEEIPDAVLDETTARVAGLAGEIRALLDDGGIGEKIRDGMEIVILGPPNAGKSSLLNALARRDVAIVSEHAGTTRDMIEVHLELGGYAVTLIDTAGLREQAEHAVEEEGMRRARARAARADFTLLLLDGRTAAQTYPDFAAEAEGALLVLTKSDIASPPTGLDGIALSTVTGDGMERLITALRAKVEARMVDRPSPLITRARHRATLAEALRPLEGWTLHAPLEISCEQLRASAAALGKMTGKIWVDDVLDLVFSRFCIGK
jgi:tRNA modification GTPase